MKKILVVGGAGFVGSLLVPKLLKRGYQVRIYDLFLFSRSKKLGEDIYGDLTNNPNLELIKGDVRNFRKIDQAVKGMDGIIHLACLSNDASVELDKELSREINYLAFFPFLKAVNQYKIKRLIYASSSCVYGLREEKQVTEELPLEPITTYGVYKMYCEKAIQDHVPLSQTEWVILRPATLCGYAPRLRLDLTVNILTNHAVNKSTITVFGGVQERPNLHVEDVTDLYVKLLELPKEKVAGQIFNVGYNNLSVMNIAKLVKKVIGDKTEILVTPSEDIRSFRISSQKIKKVLGWKPKHSIEDASRDLMKAFQAGRVLNPLEDPIYWVSKVIQQANLKKML